MKTKTTLLIVGALFAGIARLSAQTVAANFSAASGCPVTTISFTDLSTGAPTAWAWNFGNLTTLSDTSNLQNPTYTYPGPGTYTVTLVASNSGSSSTKTSAVIVSASPAVTGTNVVCNGSCATLTATGGGTYSWSPTGETSSSVTVCPATSTTYTVTVDNAGCTQSITASVTVNPNPITSVPNANICPGNQAILTASGGTTYTWSPGTGLSATTGTTVTANPANTTTYTVVGTSLGCTSSTMVFVTVGALVADAGPDATICYGGAVTLNGKGGTVYAWSPATGLNSASIANPTASPTITTTYTLTVADGACSDEDVVIVTVNPSPPMPSLIDTAVCPGSSITITASGANTYTWAPATGLSNITGSTVTVNPTTTTTYTVIGSNATGCTASTKVRVVVVAAVAGPDLAICSGSGAVINAFGGGSYSWSPTTGLSNSTISNPFASPVATTTYTLSVSAAGGCTSTDEVIVSVNTTIPTVTTSGDVTICQGEATQLTAGGASTYSWLPGTALSATTGSTVYSNPISTTTYTVTGNLGGCTDTATVIVTVKPGPIVAISGTTAICSGQSTTLTASGGGTYSWNTGATTSAITVSPTVTTGYIVTVASGNGCTVSQSVIVSMPKVLAYGNSATCGLTNGSCVTYSAGGGAPPYNYNWVPTGATSPTITGLSAGTYTVTMTDMNGCTTNATATVVNTGPPPSIVLDTIININCSGTTFGTIKVHGISGSPAYTYYWSPSGNTTSMATNLITGTYTVTITDNNGCTATAAYTVKNFSNLYASVNTTPTNCGIKGTATVSATGDHPPFTYQWNDAASQTTATATNLSAGTYSIVITDSLGCKLTGAVFISQGGYCANIIKGRIYDDVNQNCIQDLGEQGLQGRTVMAMPSYSYGYTDANGDYTILTPDMNNTVKVYASYNYGCDNSSLSCPASGSLTVNFAQGGDTSFVNNFGYYYNPGSFDLDIHPGWTPGHPGFTKKYWIYYGSNSPTSKNVLIRFIYDPILQFTSCNLGGIHFPAQHKIEWTFNNVPAYYTWDWNSKPEAEFMVPTSASITDSLYSYFEILPITGDCDPNDNVLDINEPITGSRDPNSKAVIPEGQGPNGNILKKDSVLFYNIHFQNNGNDTAYTVVVQDTLSPYLDPATIVPGASSHPYTFNLSRQGILTFRFDKIMLPDSTTDEPASNGYFNYTVKVRPNAAIGSVIKNTAYIYFDFNGAVITNTTVNTITTPIGIEELSSSNDAVSVYPNPFSDNTRFVIRSEKSNEVYSFELMDVLGKQVRSIKEITGKEFQVSRNGLPNGIYFYKIYSDESIVGIGKLVIK